MNNFERLKSMSVEEISQWLDKNGMWDNSPWSKWWDKKYCSKCESVEVTVEDDFGERECEFAWCELENKCRYFEDREEVPDCGEIIKMWLEAEVENA